MFPFTDEALQALFTLTKGNPRTVCGIAQMSLEVAAARNQLITPIIIKEVSERRYV